VSVATGLSVHTVGKAAVGIAFDVTTPEHPETHATLASKMVRQFIWVTDFSDELRIPLQHQLIPQ
jgi:hypothetical protein